MQHLLEHLQDRENIALEGPLVGMLPMEIPAGSKEGEVTSDRCAQKQARYLVRE